MKATYLLKFAPFIDWPARSFGSATSPFVLCVEGDDPFGPLLDEAAAGQRLDGRPVAIRRMAVVDGQSGCEIVYVGGSSAQSVAAALAAVRGLPVLTVTDTELNGGPMGVTDFVIVAGRVRFAVNLAAAEDRLAISSKLLGLAVRVVRR